MYHSITIGSMNTFTDWHLVPDGRPVIAMPELKTTYVEVPGMSGALDLSEALTKYPTYKNRKGSLKFHVLNDYEPWEEKYEILARYLNGSRRKLILEDDPDWYYEGRIIFKEWTSNNDGTWSDVTIDYDLDPFKYSNRILNSGVLSIDSTTTPVNYSFRPTYIGLSHATPVNMQITSIGTAGITLSFTNPELSINVSGQQFSERKTYTLHGLSVSNYSGNNTSTFSLTGKGSVIFFLQRRAL